MIRPVPQNRPARERDASPPAPRICLVDELLDLLLCHGRVAEPRGNVVHRSEHEDHLSLHHTARAAARVRELCRYKHSAEGHAGMPA